jgi:hypothetical protein
MQLCRLSRERGHADGVLEESSGVAVVAVGSRRRQAAIRPPDVVVAKERVDGTGESLVGDLGGEELEEAVELVRVAAKSRRQRCRIRIVGRLDRSDLDLQASAESLDPTEDVHCVALVEPLIEELDVVPDTSLDPSARVGELEREVGGPVPRALALLLRDGEHALHGPVLGKLGDRGHRAESMRALVRTRHVGTLAAMAHAQPFRAVRYAGAAGPLADLVAPPYDAVDDAERAELYARSPYNVLHLTLPGSADEAARTYREWLDRGLLERDEDASAWLAVETYVGPDGVARERKGLIASLPAEPYETGAVLPHERTHASIREERLRLLRATRVQPETIFLLTDRSITTATPAGKADIEVGGTRLWRVAAPDVDLGQLLIADGHHRYECAVELGREQGERTRIMALVVSKDDPGLHVFPTHRVFAGRPDLARPGEGETCRDLEEAWSALDAASYERSGAIAYRRAGAELVRGEEGELDAELVDRHGLDGISYTARADEAVAAVDRGEADVAFLLREPRVDDVFAVALRGDRMPAKSTYFYPKPLSGLVFHPLDP